jgi:hypothetical protein
MSLIKKDNLLLISHTSGIDGPIHFLKYYLESKNRYKIRFIEFILPEFDRENILVSQKNKILKKIKPFKNKSIQLVCDFIISLQEILKFSPKYIIGANSFNVFPAILLKIFYNYKIIFFASDYSSNRFDSFFKNFIYNIIENLAIKNSDLVISNTFRAEKARLKKGLIKNKSIVIPNNFYGKRFSLSKRKIEKDNFIYIGNVTKEHGLLKFITANKTLIKKLTIIGQGNEIQKIKVFCKKNNIKLNLFLNKSHNFVISKIKNFNGFALAPYTKDLEWTFYCSPLKVSEYIYSGLPVIISSVPEISKEIEKKYLGIRYKKLTKIKEELDNFNLNKFFKRNKKYRDQYYYKESFKKIIL